jgi:putative transposase
VLLSRWFNWRDALIEASDLDRLAPQGLPPLLALEVRSWPAVNPCRAATSDPKKARENASWGEERIANELLLKLGLSVSPRTVRKYMPKLPAAQASGPRGDQRWATFLKNHARVIIACDFCVAVTATFRILYVLVVMEDTLGD